jgi:hypothetical protein
MSEKTELVEGVDTPYSLRWQSLWAVRKNVFTECGLHAFFTPRHHLYDELLEIFSRPDKARDVISSNFSRQFDKMLHNYIIALQYKDPNFTIGDQKIRFIDFTLRDENAIHFKFKTYCHGTYAKIRYTFFCGGCSSDYCEYKGFLCRNDRCHFLTTHACPDDACLFTQFLYFKDYDIDLPYGADKS